MQKAKRSIARRSFVGFIWFVAIFIAIVFALAELTGWYAHSVAQGDEALRLDKALSEKLGETVGLWSFFVVAIVVAKLSVKGCLPGTGEFKKHGIAMHDAVAYG